MHLYQLPVRHIFKYYYDCHLKLLLICITLLEQEIRLRRINDVHILLHKIPKQNFNMLELLVKHLCRYEIVLKLYMLL